MVQPPEAHESSLIYFKAFMNDKIKVVPLLRLICNSLREVYYSLNQIFLQEMYTDIVKSPSDEEDISNGFKFGYKAEPLQKMI